MNNNNILRWQEIQKLTGLSRSTVWRLENQHNFPQRIKISTRTVGWLAAKIEDWVLSRTRITETKQGDHNA